jgi:hypothetical protein
METRLGLDFYHFWAESAVLLVHRANFKDCFRGEKLGIKTVSHNQTCHEFDYLNKQQWSIAHIIIASESVQEAVLDSHRGRPKRKILPMKIVRPI